MAKKKTLKKKAKSLKGAKKKSPLAEENWPTKRNVFFRPNRLKYVRKMVKDDGCVFCRSAADPISFESLCVYKSKYSQIVLNKYPYNNGHLLVLPLSHTGDFIGLNDDLYNDLQRTLRIAVGAVQAVYAPHGFNLGMNHGATGGAGIPDHLHYHIVPRWNGDLNFFPLVANTKLVVETLETSYEKFSTYFKEKAL